MEPVLSALGGIPVSVDTSKAAVARRALELGAVLVNDVTALRGDPELAGVVADSDAYLCLMHMLGEPPDVQNDPRYDGVVSEVAAFLEERLGFAVQAGIAEERICLDPRIGFGKTTDHNLELLARLGEIAALGRPVLVGASRRRFLGRILGEADALAGPVSAGVAGGDARVRARCVDLRVHDVPEGDEASRGTRGRGGGGMSGVTIELEGLELRGFHGALAEERKRGQTFPLRRRAPRARRRRPDRQARRHRRLHEGGRVHP